MFQNVSSGSFGIGFGGVFVEQVFPLTRKQRFLTIFPPAAPSLALIATLIQLAILFSRGMICGVISGFSTRLKTVMVTVGFVYTFLKLWPYAFIEVTPAALSI